MQFFGIPKYYKGTHMERTLNKDSTILIGAREENYDDIKSQNPNKKVVKVYRYNPKAKKKWV